MRPVGAHSAAWRLGVLISALGLFACGRSRAEACDLSCQLLVTCGQQIAADRLSCDDAAVLPKCAGIPVDECPLCLAEKRCSDFDGGNPCPSSCRGLTL